MQSGADVSCEQRGYCRRPLAVKQRQRSADIPVADERLTDIEARHTHQRTLVCAPDDCNWDAIAGHRPLLIRQRPCLQHVTHHSKRRWQVVLPVHGHVPMHSSTINGYNSRL